MSHLKDSIKRKYSNIAKSTKTTEKSSSCQDLEKDAYSNISEDYSDVKGYDQQADLGLGCGLPTEFAKIKKGGQ